MEKFPPLSSKQLEPLLVSIDDIQPHPENYKIHPPEQIKSLRASLKTFGWTTPIKANLKGVIIAGHGMYELAQQDGYTHVPVEYCALDDNLSKAYLVADNETARRAETDHDKLNKILEESIQIPDFDIESTGFSSDYLNEILNFEHKEVVEDEFNSDEEVETRCKEGDLWQLGRHRLLCGDSTKKEDVERLLNGASIDLCLTDPPYGLDDTESEKNNYNLYEDTKVNLLKTIKGFLPIAQTIAKCVVFTPGNGNTQYYPPPTWTMAWFTPAGVGRGPWGFCCWQPILCYGKDPKLSKRLGCHPDAIVHTEAAEKFGHPCTKPINFWGWLLERTSEIKELIYDPFCGSGTTLIACEQLNRTCYGMELDPHYCDVILSRWEQFTGQTAKKLD